MNYGSSGLTRSLAAVWLMACGEPPVSSSVLASAATTSAVIDGTGDPTNYGFPMAPWERNAALGQIVVYGNQRYQGCSATLIGASLVMTAGHCVILNQEEWLGGALPEVTDTDSLRYVVGRNAEHPECELQAASASVHPDISVGETDIVHDIALIVLADSVLDICPSVVPVAPYDTAPDAVLVGASMAQGGFGSLGRNYDFSVMRLWSVVTLAAIEADHIVLEDTETGFPTFGDSGSGALWRAPDGRLRLMGVASTSVPGSSPAQMSFVRADVQSDFVAAETTPATFCGAALEGPRCQGEVVVTCIDDRLIAAPCPSGETCAEERGVPTCQAPATSPAGKDDGCATQGAWALAGPSCLVLVFRGRRRRPRDRR